MRERIARFMYGRYGQDQLNIFLLIAAVVLMVLGAFTGKVGSFLNALSLALLVLTWIRMLSKNLPRRRAENARYLDLRYRVTGWFRRLKTRWDQRRDYRFFSCPSCHTTLRVPKGRGKIRIVCRKCGTSFTRKS
ncbi:MAG: hypothetical protein IK149_00390 [Oscillospiraceae bacterium]|nr:hypothetical protein [Oscillospiraceae bacterium]